VLYQMLAGRLPFDGSPLDMARKNLYEKVPSILERAGHRVDPTLEAITMKLLEKRPEKRYQSAHEIIDDLQPLFTAGTGPSLSAVKSNKVSRLRTASRHDAHAVAVGDTVLSEPALTQLGSAAPRGRALTFVILTVAISAAVALGYVLANRGDGESAPTKVAAAEEPSPAPLAQEEPIAEVPAAVPDAGAPKVEIDEPAIATAETETKVPTKAAKSRRASARDRTGSRRRGAKTKSEPEPNPELAEETLLKRFETEVVSTSQAIERLQKARGRDVFLRYKTKMDNTGYMRAFTVASKRSAMIKKLRSLRREVQGMLK